MKRAITILTVASATLLFVSTASAGLNDGLAAYYKFDGDATDATENGHDGTVYGATLTAGISGGAYRFDGVDDYIQADATGLPTGARTVAFWFYAYTVANHPGLLGYGGEVCGTSWIMIANNRGTSPPCFQMQGHCAYNEIDWPYGTPPVGAWYHFAVTTDSAGTTMYVNGEMKVEDDTFANNTDVDGTDLAIGVIVSPNGLAPYVDGNTSYFTGVIDEVRIYDRALSRQEVGQLARVGACCLNVVCDIHSEADCRARGGTYQGNGTLCDVNPCWTSSIGDGSERPPTLRLSASPTPGAGDVQLSYQLPAPTAVTLEIFSASGSLVRRLTGGEQPAGWHAVRWDGRDDTGHETPAGIFLVRMITTAGMTRGRIVLVK